mgnify:CR=1 FL=1
MFKLAEELVPRLNSKKFLAAGLVGWGLQNLLYKRIGMQAESELEQVPQMPIDLNQLRNSDPEVIQQFRGRMFLDIHIRHVIHKLSLFSTNCQVITLVFVYRYLNAGLRITKQQAFALYLGNFLLSLCDFIQVERVYNLCSYLKEGGDYSVQNIENLVFTLKSQNEMKLVGAVTVAHQLRFLHKYRALGICSIVFAYLCSDPITISIIKKPQ